MFKSSGTKSIKVSGLVPTDFCKFFTHVLLTQSERTKIVTDQQVPKAKAILEHEIMFDTLLEYLWPLIEAIVQEELLPTYSYARLYSNGDILEKHVDRPACEVSVTLQLGKSHDYCWPIFMGGTMYQLNEGDAVVYSGCDVEHWRNKCMGPEGYHSGQVFLHYVRKNGKYADEYADKRNINFVKNRVL
jgi:hypothetical protein